MFLLENNLQKKTQQKQSWNIKCNARYMLISNCCKQSIEKRLLAKSLYRSYSFKAPNKWPIIDRPVFYALNFPKKSIAIDEIIN